MRIRLPIAYFGAIGYYQKYICADRVCFEVNEHYTKQTLRNRMYILGPNGVQQLPVPVKKINGSKTAVKDILISYREDWVKLHLKTLETAYSSSPFYDHYIFDIQPVYEEKIESLMELNQRFHQLITGWLDIERSSFYSEQYDLIEGEKDFRLIEELPATEVNYRYQQVFDKNRIFEGNLSILDALFNLGPMARTLLINNELCR